MIIVDKITTLEKLKSIEAECYFDDMIKCVADVDRDLIAVNGELHSDLEELLLENGSSQRSLYGFNIMLDDGEIEFDSMINPPRNKDDGYPRGGRYVSSPEKQQKIREIVEKWIEL